MQVQIPNLTIIRKKETGGIFVLIGAPFKDMISDAYEIVYEYAGGRLGEGSDIAWFATFAHLFFLGGAQWARENPDKEIGED